MIVKCFWLSLVLACLFVVLRGLLLVTSLPGVVLWFLLAIALITGIASVFSRSFEK